MKANVSPVLSLADWLKTKAKSPHSWTCATKTVTILSFSWREKKKRTFLFHISPHLSLRALVPQAFSQWSRLFPSFCPSCRAAIASFKCSFRLWISRSFRPFIPLSSSCTSVYRLQASCFSCRVTEKLSGYLSVTLHPLWRKIFACLN